MRLSHCPHCTASHTLHSSPFSPCVSLVVCVCVCVSVCVFHVCVLLLLWWLQCLCVCVCVCVVSTAMSSTDGASKSAVISALVQRLREGKITKTVLFEKLTQVRRRFLSLPSLQCLF